MPVRFGKLLTFAAFAGLVLAWPEVVLAQGDALVEPFSEPLAEPAEGALPWWAWPLLLFVVSFLIGCVAVLGGVGGGVMFVPIVSGFFPFHLDFVRGAGLLVALAGSLSAGPGLLRSGYANLRLAMPLALLASASAIVGAMLGLALPTHVVQIALGAAILGIVVLMLAARKSEHPDVPAPDRLSAALGIHGVFRDTANGQLVDWKAHRTPVGLALFVVIGVMAGMFGLGAGWANVPVLNLVMGAPLKVSVATSNFLLGIVDTSAAWVYLHQGAVLAIIAVPSIVGMMLGSLVGVRLLGVTRSSTIRWIVIVMLLLAGGRALMKGVQDMLAGPAAADTATTATTAAIATTRAAGGPTP